MLGELPGPRSCSAAVLKHDAGISDSKAEDGFRRCIEASAVVQEISVLSAQNLGCCHSGCLRSSPTSILILTCFVDDAARFHAERQVDHASIVGLHPLAGTLSHACRRE